MTQTKLATRILPAVLTIGGLVGLLAASILTLEKIRALEEPGYSPVCSINPVINCVTVTDTSQGQVFGIPHSLIGIAAFAVVATVGVIMLTKGRLHKRFWRVFNVGALAGLIIVHYFIFQSLYRLNALCIYCMVTWIAVAPIAWYATLFNLEQDYVGLSSRFKKAKTFMLAHHGKILAVWFAAVFLLIVHRFWAYWVTLV